MKTYKNESMLVRGQTDYVLCEQALSKLRNLSAGPFLSKAKISLEQIYLQDHSKPVRTQVIV